MTKKRESETDKQGEGKGESDAGRRRLGRQRQCKFCADEKIQIDYKNASLLKYFISDRGKLVPRRITGNCARHQRAIAVAIGRARMIAMMPFAVTRP
jgi:small subunit ribosomal protein S18